MAEKKKNPRPRARLPRGFADRDAAEIRATEAMLGRIRAVYERYGFEPVETPFFEYTDALGKFLPDSDRPNEGVFSLQDDDEQWLSLRYDLTAPLARHIAETINTVTLPSRTYRAGWVFRNEKPGPGRFRQFMQFDADVVGAPGVAADAEMAMMMADTMEALGIARGDYIVRVNNRKVLDGVMEAIGVTDEGQKLTVLRAIDKLDKFGVEGVRQLLGAGRKDESGDFTKGAGLRDDQASAILARLDADPRDDPDLSAVAALVANAGFDGDRIRIDPSVVRGLEYYTGTVFECELTFPVVNEQGETVRFGSVAGGGRYDGLVKRFTGQDVPATGFSIGVSRLMAALRNLGKLDAPAHTAPVLVTVMDGERMGDYMALAQRLRDGLNMGRDGTQAGPPVPVELYQGNWKKFGNQLRYADRRGCPIVIIQGSEERERGVVQLKDMIEGRRQAAAIESNEEWREARPGQVEVAQEKIVEEVRRLLMMQETERLKA